MNLYVMTVTCEVCGEEGSSTVKTATSGWYEDGIIRHIDPAVCAENLRWKNKQK